MLALCRICVRTLNLVGLLENYDEGTYVLDGSSIRDLPRTQRVAIVRAIVKSPRSIILADEPTGNFDEENSRNIINLLKEINAKNNCTLIIATHDKDVAQSADYCLQVKNRMINKITETAGHFRVKYRISNH